MASWITLCNLDDIPRRGARRVVRAAGLPVAVFRTGDDRVFALLDRCPHRGGPLSQGLVAGHTVACPLHDWTIGLADGRAVAPDEGTTPTFACRLDGDAVQLDRDELAARALDLAAPTAGGSCQCACA